MSRIPTLADLGDVTGKRVLVRTDFNVPMDDGVITDDFRIRSALPTIEWLTERGAHVVCARTSVDRRASRIRSTRWMRSEPASASSRPAPSSSRTCDSTRAKRPTIPQFVAKLVEGIDAYVDDAFGACHRAHASIVGPPRTLPSAMGLLMQREVEVLLGLRNDPKHPFVAVLGGARRSATSSVWSRPC